MIDTTFLRPGSPRAEQNVGAVGLVSNIIGLAIASTAMYLGYQRGQGLKCPRHKTDPTWTKPQAILTEGGSFTVEIRSWDGPLWDGGPLEDCWLFIDGQPLRVFLGKDKTYQHFCEMVRQLTNTTPAPILKPGNGEFWQTLFTYEGALGGSHIILINPTKRVVVFSAAVLTPMSDKP